MDSGKLQIEIVNLENKHHCEQLIKLLNEYMEHEMGLGKSMDPGLDVKIIEGLRNYPCYLGFFLNKNNNYVGLANCNNIFSTFKAAKVLNIHDFIVSKNYRGKGTAQFFMKSILHYAKANNYCKVNLEVREDNFKAQALYQKTGFNDCDIPMKFWEIKFF